MKNIIFSPGHLPRGHADADEPGEGPAVQQEEASHRKRLRRGRIQRRGQRAKLQTGGNRHTLIFYFLVETNIPLLVS